MKSVPNRFGLIALIIIFLMLYGYFSTLGLSGNLSSLAPAIEAEDGSVTLGSLGGAHLLRGITYTDEQTYYRVAIDTRLNRPSVIEHEIITPHARVQQVDNATPIVVDGESRTLPSLGAWRIQVDLSDTRTTELDGGEVVPVFVGPDIMRIAQDPLTEIRLNYDPDGSAVQVLIGLTNKSIFRADDNGAGTIFVDILK